MSSFREQLRQYARDFFTNWRTYDGPFVTKLGLTARNRVKSVVTLKGCCGHLGQPGC